MELELQVTLRGNLACVVGCVAPAWEKTGTRANIVVGLGLFWGYCLLLLACPPSFFLLEMLKSHCFRAHSTPTDEEYSKD